MTISPWVTASRTIHAIKFAQDSYPPDYCPRAIIPGQLSPRQTPMKFLPGQLIAPKL